MSKIFLALVFLLFSASQAVAQIDTKLVGSYQMEVPGGDILELRANGIAILAGEQSTWSAQGNRLSVGSDVMSYQLQGNRLILQMGTAQIAWKKLANGRTDEHAQSRHNSTANTDLPPLHTPETNKNQDAQARQLLMRNAWCSFTYNKISGTSTTRKVVFRSDGIMTINGGAETYSSGYGGTYAGQSNSANQMQWKLENLRLYVNSGNGFQDIGLNATTNSNGYVILNAEGREYSMCN